MRACEQMCEILLFHDKAITFQNIHLPKCLHVLALKAPSFNNKPSNRINQTYIRKSPERIHSFIRVRWARVSLVRVQKRYVSQKNIFGIFIEIGNRSVRFDSIAMRLIKCIWYLYTFECANVRKCVISYVFVCCQDNLNRIALCKYLTVLHTVCDYSVVSLFVFSLGIHPQQM